ncbi:MAG: protein-L-isoaspartate O-methyltransferase family protein [Acidimicrobiales bacterium]
MGAPRRASARTLRRRMVEGLQANGTLTDGRVREAFLAVPREHFLPATAEAEGLEAVYVDRAVITRKDDRGAPTSSSSQPGIMAIMLERLELRPGHRVLEIGAGTGYNAALLATLVGGTGSVVSVDVQGDLATAAGRAVATAGYGSNVQVVQGDGREGWAAGAPYHRIVLTASTGTLQRPWLDQLAPEGLLQLPLHLEGPAVQAVVTLRKEGDRLRSTDVDDGAFMVLRDAQLRTVGPQGSGISVTEQVDGEHRSLASLAGDGLRRLTPGARRRLAEVMLQPPAARRRLRLGPESHPWLYLRLGRPQDAVMLSSFRSGQPRVSYGPVAAATTDGRSLAVLAPTEGGRAVTLESNGDRRAAGALVALLDDWRAHGRPGLHDLLVEAHFGSRGAAVVRTRWPHSSTVSSRR